MYSKMLLSWVSTVGEIFHVFSCLPRLQIRCEHLLSLLVKSSLRWWEAALLCNFTSMTDCSQMAGKAGLWNSNISIEYIVWVIFLKTSLRFRVHKSCNGRWDLFAYHCLRASKWWGQVSEQAYYLRICVHVHVFIHVKHFRFLNIPPFWWSFLLPVVMCSS